MKRVVKRILNRKGGRKAPFASGMERTENDIAMTNALLQVLSPMVNRDERLYNRTESVDQELVTAPVVLRMPYRSFFPSPEVSGQMDSRTVNNMLAWMNGRGLLHRVGRHTSPAELRYFAVAMMVGTENTRNAYVDGDRVIRVNNDGRGEDPVWFAMQPFWNTWLWDLVCALTQRLSSENVMFNYIVDERECCMEQLPELKDEEPEEYRAMAKEDWNRPWFRRVIKSMTEPRSLNVEIQKVARRIDNEELLDHLHNIDAYCHNMAETTVIPDVLIQKSGNDLLPEHYIHPIVWGQGAQTITKNVEERININMGEMWYFYDVETTMIKNGNLIVTDTSSKYAKRVGVRQQVDTCQLRLNELLVREREQRRKLTSIIK